MNLKILVPFNVFACKEKVMSIVAESVEGSFGILPNRLDCIAALVPGILTYRLEANEDVYIAIDQGILVKVGLNVTVSVRRAISGSNLEQLRDSLEKEFIQLDDDERAAEQVLSKVESALTYRLAELYHD
ncbi:MAG: F0F1 ATP synthase subunit epsilon [Chitinophagaceae bacterium]|nr:F0F1 ATP synthase subunit epsilon [Oligoflexus sp.]